MVRQLEKDEESGFDKNKNGVLESEEIASVTVINVTGHNIRDLTGINVFYNVTELGCLDNQLTSLDLNNASSLTYLNCYNNQLTSLNLSNASALSKLYCGNNQLTSLDLSNVSALTYLDCATNKLTSLILGNTSALTWLDCSDSQLTSLDLGDASALGDLLCGGNQLTSLDLGNASSFYYLVCGGNQLTSLDLSNVSSVSWLDCSDNQLTSLDLSHVSSLDGLWCGGNKLASLDLGNFSDLKILYCADNLLTSLDFSNNPILREVDCSYNYMKDTSMVTGWKEKDSFIFEPQKTPSTPSPYPSVEPTVEPTVPPTIAPTTTPEPTIVPTTTPEPTIVPTITPEPTIVPTTTPEPTIVPTAAPEPTIVPTATPIPTITPAATPEPTATPTVTPAQTPTITPSPSIVPDETFSAEPELGTRRVDLSWKKVDDADGYIIFIKEESTGKFKRLKTIWGADVISFSKLLDFGGTHTFKIQSFKQDKETHTSQYTDLGNEITLTLSQYSKYEQPTAKASTKTGSRQINLQWSKVEGADGYLLYMYNKETKKYDLLETLTGTDSTSFSFVNGLKNGETYSFRVRSYAVDKDGETQVKGKISAAFKTTTPPAKAQKPKAVSTTANQAKLTWTEMSTADGYSIYRCTSRNGKYTRVKTITDKDTITFTDKNLNSGITYYYKMRAFSLNPDGTRSYGKASAVKAVKIK